MKIRTGFVTNSSSSSFILAFKNMEDGVQEIIKELKFNKTALGQVLTDFIESDPINLDILKKLFEFTDYYEAREYLNQNKDIFKLSENARENILSLYGSLLSKVEDNILYTSNYHDTDFLKDWLAKNPDKKRFEIYKSQEYQDKMKARMPLVLEEFFNKIGNNSYIVSLEYEDNTSSLGSELEHHIMPNCDFVIESFSHH